MVVGTLIMVCYYLLHEILLLESVIRVEVRAVIVVVVTCSNETL